MHFRGLHMGFERKFQHTFYQNSTVFNYGIDLGLLSYYLDPIRSNQVIK